MKDSEREARLKELASKTNLTPHERVEMERLWRQTLEYKQSFEGQLEELKSAWFDLKEALGEAMVKHWPVVLLMVLILIIILLIPDEVING